MLSGSLDVEATLRELAKLAIPTIADWCVVLLTGPDGVLSSIQRGAIVIDMSSITEFKSPTTPWPRPSNCRRDISPPVAFPIRRSM